MMKKSCFISDCPLIPSISFDCTINNTFINNTSKRFNSTSNNVKVIVKSNKLHNIAKMARSLADNELKNLKYDLATECWYIYENDIWNRIPTNLALQKVWNVLENKPETCDKLTPEYNKQVLAALVMCSGTFISSRQ